MTRSPKWRLKCVVRSSGPKRLSLCRSVEYKSKYKATVYAHECTLAFHSNWCVYRAASTCCILFCFFVFFIIFIFWSSFKNTNMLTWHVPSLSPYLCSCLLNIFCMSLLPVCRNPAKEDSETPWPAVLGKSLFLLVYTARSQSLLSPSLSLCTHTAVLALLEQFCDRQG